MGYHSMEALLDVIYPHSCIGCEGLIEGSPFKNICTRCVSHLHRVAPPCCGVCGYPILGAVEEDRVCPHCIDLEPIFESGRTLLLHRGLGREIIQRLKYHRAFYLLEDVQTIMKMCSWLPGFLENSVLVPVPLHARKQRERGYNQSLVLAQCFSAAGNGLPIADVLVRTKDTDTQTRLKRGERRRNISNAFAVSEKEALRKDVSYIVIDDVFTTGVTLNACCRVLRKSGARNLRVLTLAHG